MTLQDLLGCTSLSSFVADYFHRLPFSSAGTAAPLCDLGTWTSLTKILAHDSADVLVCRRNEQHAGDRPQTTVDAQALIDSGYTLLIRHAERHDQRVAELAAEFERNLAAPVNIHMYCTPVGQYGFGWHYDAEEVFIVQTTGRKEYQLRKNTVNPWPLEETLPTDMRYEREIMPLIRCELAAGDWLYIPSGYWHMGQSKETAISLAIGVQPRTAVHVFDYLRPRILESLLWRQRLPVAGQAAAASNSELQEQYAAIFKQLGDDLQRLLTNRQTVDAFLANIRLTQSAPQSTVAAAPADPKA